MQTTKDAASVGAAAGFPFRLASGEMPQVIAFDLDDTLITGDSLLLWHEWLYETGIVPERRWLDVIERMMREYHEGRLDMAKSLAELIPSVGGFEPEVLSALLERFIDERIVPRIRREGRALIAAAQSEGLPVVLISATTAYIVRPIAKRLGIEDPDNVLGIELKTKNGRLTGEIDGTPSFREGKVVRLANWLAEHRPGTQLSQVFFFTDSANDLPLAIAAGGAGFVNPDPVLEAHAHERRAPVLFWHSPYDDAQRGHAQAETEPNAMDVDDPDAADDVALDARAGRSLHVRQPDMAPGLRATAEADEEDD